MDFLATDPFRKKDLPTKKLSGKVLPQGFLFTSQSGIQIIVKRACRLLGSVDILDYVILNEVQAKNLRVNWLILVTNLEILRHFAPKNDVPGEMSTRPSSWHLSKGEP